MAAGPRAGRVAGHRGCITIVHMSTTLTIRTDDALREELAKRASAQGKTVSEVAREILRNALEERALEQEARGYHWRVLRIAADDAALCPILAPRNAARA